MTEQQQRDNELAAAAAAGDGRPAKSARTAGGAARSTARHVVRTCLTELALLSGAVLFGLHSLLAAGMASTHVAVRPLHCVSSDSTRLRWCGTGNRAAAAGQDQRRCAVIAVAPWPLAARGLPALPCLTPFTP